MQYQRQKYGPFNTSTIVPKRMSLRIENSTITVSNPPHSNYHITGSSYKSEMFHNDGFQATIIHQNDEHKIIVCGSRRMGDYIFVGHIKYANMMKKVPAHAQQRIDRLKHLVKVEAEKFERVQERVSVAGAAMSTGGITQMAANSKELEAAGKEMNRQNQIYLAAVSDLSKSQMEVAEIFVAIAEDFARFILSKLDTPEGLQERREDSQSRRNEETVSPEEKERSPCDRSKSRRCTTRKKLRRGSSSKSESRLRSPSRTDRSRSRSRSRGRDQRRKQRNSNDRGLMERERERRRDRGRSEHRRSPVSKSGDRRSSPRFREFMRSVTRNASRSRATHSNSTRNYSEAFRSVSDGMRNGMTTLSTGLTSLSDSLADGMRTIQHVTDGVVESSRHALDATSQSTELIGRLIDEE